MYAVLMSAIEIIQVGPDTAPEFDINRFSTYKGDMVTELTLSQDEALDLFNALARELGREISPGVFATEPLS